MYQFIGWMRKKKMMEKSCNSSSNDECRIHDEAVRNTDTRLVNPASLSMTHADIKDIKASKFTDASHTFTKVDTDGNFSSTRVFPDVRFDRELSKKYQ